MNAFVLWFEHSLVLPFLVIRMRIDLFQSSGHCWVFQIWCHVECSTLIASSFKILNSSAGIPSLPLALLAADFLRPTWFHTPECLALSERIVVIQDIEDLFLYLLLCMLSISSWSLLLLLGLYHFCPLLCPSLDEFWYIQFWILIYPISWINLEENYIIFCE